MLAAWRSRGGALLNPKYVCREFEVLRGCVPVTGQVYVERYHGYCDGIIDAGDVAQWLEYDGN